MFKYIYESGNTTSHSLNAKRLSIDTILLANSLDDIVDEIQSSEQCALMSDYFLIDNLYTDIVNESTCDIELFLLPGRINSTWLPNLLKKLNIEIENISDSIFSCYMAPSFIKKINQKNYKNITIKLNEIQNIQQIVNANDIQKFALTTKGKTLAFFNGLINAKIEPGITLTYADWITITDESLKRLSFFTGSDVIIRSSAISEDTQFCSNAGAYTSVMNVDADNKEALKEAINTVFLSYDDEDSRNQVLIQKQIQDVLMSGVCSSRVIGKNAPYFVVNYDDSSGKTDTVTSGATNLLKTLYISRFCEHKKLNIHPTIKHLISNMIEIEKTSLNSALDVEFIIDNQSRVNIVQVRPLVGNYTTDDDHLIEARLQASKKLFNMYKVNNNGILSGNKAIFGIMPDANPAELIGIKPKPLAFSLYQRLITDDVVTAQRSEYGYNDVRPIKHMIKIGGSPYVDVRSSFNSFTPKLLDKNLNKNLINLYLDRLDDNKNLHDKVEFDIVVSTWFPGIETWLQEHYGENLSTDNLKKIIDASKEIFLSALTRVDSDLKDVDAYSGLFTSIQLSDNNSLYKAYSMIEVCHHHGCKPFAHLARSAFVAIAILKGLVNKGIMTSDEYNEYLYSIKSIGTQMEQDAFDVKNNKLDKNIFYDIYGHLRPGTYDVCNNAYFENPEKFLDPIIKNSVHVDKSSFELSETTKKKIEQCFSKSNLSISFKEFDNFSRQAIHGREYGKFSYTKYLSHGLNHLIEWGNSYGISRYDLAYLTVNDIHDLVSGSLIYDLTEINNIIKTRKDEYNIDSHIELPEIISQAMDFDCFYMDPGQPNYITGKSVNMEIIIVSSQVSPDSLELEGKIALIESADPGYDWLFGRSITGLITKYGGANSHMAIRCAELNIPAAIGVGEIIYNSLLDTKNVLLNCANKSIEYS
jgi:glutamine kinase